MITAEVKKISGSKKELNIVMPKEDLEPIRQRETQKIRKDVQLPGFRKGKAPLNMVKRAYGQYIEAYTMESAVQEAVEKAIEENDIQPVGSPEPKKVEFNDDGDLVMGVEVEVMPEIELKNYKGFEFIKDKYVVEESFVDNEIEKLLKQRATHEEVDRPVQEGDVILIDMQQLDEDGTPQKGRLYTDISVTIGENRFDSEIEKMLIGKEKGVPHRIEKEYPADAPQKELAGKKEYYDITIKKIEQVTLPELNDDFVKSVAPDVESVEAFKEMVRKNIETEYSREAETRLHQELMQKILDENPLDMPVAMVERYLDNLVDDMKRRDPNADERSLREYYRGEAEQNLKWMYLKEEIAKAENIEAEEKDIEEFLNKIEDEKIRKLYEDMPGLKDQVKDNIRDEKVTQFLLDNSKITENEIPLT
ncbi:MAG: trigger factor [Calditrichaeota bacterium]|nr:MAG: trigger factor [Calditrichota bacterium]